MIPALLGIDEDGLRQRKKLERQFRCGWRCLRRLRDGLRTRDVFRRRLGDPAAASLRQWMCGGSSGDDEIIALIVGEIGKHGLYDVGAGKAAVEEIALRSIVARH